MTDTLNVLGTMRAIRDDKSLTATQAHLLMCAVLRTDNKSCKVRYSLEGLAKDANLSDKTARTAFQQSEVLKYFVRVEGRTRSKNMWFHPIPVTTTGIKDEGNRGTVAIPATTTGNEVDADTDSGNTGTHSGNPVHHSGNSGHDSGNHYRPSTLTSTSSSTSTSTSDGPTVPKGPEVPCDDFLNPKVKEGVVKEEGTSTSLNQKKTPDILNSKEVQARAKSVKQDAALSDHLVNDIREQVGNIADEEGWDTDFAADVLKKAVDPDFQPRNKSAGSRVYQAKQEVRNAQLGPSFWDDESDDPDDVVVEW